MRLAMQSRVVLACALSMSHTHKAFGLYWGCVVADSTSHQLPLE